MRFEYFNIRKHSGILLIQDRSLYTSDFRKRVVRLCKISKKNKYYDSNNATTVLAVFFHNYAHLYKCTSYNILILIPSLQKSRLFVVCFCFFFLYMIAENHIVYYF